MIGAPGDSAVSRAEGADPGSVTILRNVGGSLAYHSILDGLQAAIPDVLGVNMAFGWSIASGG